MAAVIGSISVLFDVQFDRGIAGIQRFAGAVEQGGARAQRSMRGINHAARDMNAGLAGAFSNTARSIAVLHGPLGGIASRFAAFGMLLRGTNVLLATSAAGISAMGFAAVGAVKSFADLERQQFTTSQLLRQTGHASGRTAAEIESLAQSIGMATLASTSQVREAANQLLTFKQISGETFDRTLWLAQDATASGFGNIEQNVVRLAKALQDPGRNLANLTRIGIDFSRPLENEIKLLHASGRAHEARLKILEHVESQMGGTGKAAGEGLAGSFDAASEAMSRLFENVGRDVAAATDLNDKIKALAEGIMGLADASETLVRGGMMLSGGLAAVLGARTVAGMADRVRQMHQYRVETVSAANAARQLAAAEATAARSQWLTTRLALNRAMNEGVLSASQMERQKRQVAQATTAYTAAQQRAAAATLAHNAAIRQATVSATAMATAGRALSAAWSFIGGPIGAALLAVGTAFYVTQQRAQAAQERTDRYAEAIKAAGEGSIEGANGIREAAKALTEVSEAATEAERVVRLRQAMRDIEAAFNDLQVAADRLDLLVDADDIVGRLSNPVREEVNRAIESFREGEISAEEFIAAIDEISKNNPDASDIVAELQRIAREAAAAMGVVDGLNDSIRQLGSGKGDRVGRPTMDDEQERFNFLQVFERRMRPDDFDHIKPGKEPRKARERADDYERLRDRIRESTAEMEHETRVQAGLNPLIDDFGYAMARAKAEFDLLNAAKKAGRAITPELRKEIEGLAEGFAKATVDAGKLAEAQKKVVEQMEFQKETLRGFISDLRSSLVQGEDFWESFAKAANRALDRVVDKLLNDVLDAIFKVNAASQGGSGGGGIFGLISSIFGLGGGLYQEGGYTGAGPKDRPAGVVHAGEYVFSQKAVRRIGVDDLDVVHNIASKGFSGGGFTGGVMSQIASSTQGIKEGGNVHVTVSVDDEGELRAFITRQSGRVAAAVVQSAAGPIAQQGASLSEGKIRSGGMDSALRRFGVSPQPRRR